HKPHSSASLKKPHKLIIVSPLLSTTHKPNPLSHFTSTPTTPKTPIDETTLTQETHLPNSNLEDINIEIPIRNLFIPPEKDTSTPLLTRVLKGSNIVLSKYATDALVTMAEFVKSSVKTEDCPSEGFPKFALVGRSNVGKSSLLNSLVRRKKLALTSKKPGKTQCINHFRISDSWYLVDLPGYGSTLVSVFLLIDASIPAKKIDLEMLDEIPMTLIFTKGDKRKKRKNGGKRREENVEDLEKLISGFFETTPPWIMTSSVTNQGRDEILLHMDQLRNYWLKHRKDRRETCATMLSRKIAYDSWN
ncbi:GTP binding domain, partial [Dillenia turbinata]